MRGINNINGAEKTTQSQRNRDLEELNANQILFVEFLLAEPKFDAKEAARKAGYKTPQQSAGALMKNPKVQRLIGTRIHERIEKIGVTQDRVLRELACIGFFDPRRLLDTNGGLLHLKDMPDEAAAAIKKIKVSRRSKPVKEGEDEEEETTTEVEFWSKPDALQMLAKHVGILNDAPPQVNVNVIDWQALMKGLSGPTQLDTIEGVSEPEVP